MLGIVAFFFILLWPCHSLSISMKFIAPKICVNCKHFIPSQTGLQYGKCALFEREALFEWEEKNYFLVTGGNNSHKVYCQTARNDEQMCGKEGKMYTRKYAKRVKKIIPLE